MSAVPVRPAATLVVLRDGERGIETLLLRRNSKVVFAGGAWVFPGGAVEDQDAAPGISEEQVARRAAVRETEEESGLTLDTRGLVPFAHWTTPPLAPKRYATWFFATMAVDGEVQVDGHEIEHHRWYTPEEALTDHRVGRIELMPPTFVTLTELKAAGNCAAALDTWRQRPLLRIESRFSMLGETACMLYPGDAGYDAGDPSIEGARHRCLLAADGWQYLRSDP